MASRPARSNRTHDQEHMQSESCTAPRTKPVNKRSRTGWLDRFKGIAMLSINNALARFYASASVLVTVVIAAADPYSRHAEAMYSDGARGWVAMIVLGGLALAGMLDVLVNDWFPNSFRWPFPHQHRHVIYMFIAIGMIILTLSVVQANDVGPFIIRYLLDAGVSVYIAVRGVQYHYKQRISSAHEPA